MSQPIGINPMVDFVFKLLLGSPEHAAVTIHFLRAILGARFQILSVEFRNPDLGKSYDDDKWVILDILVTDDQGRQYNIEMQTSIPAGLRQRLAFYLSRLYASQLKDGEQYQKLRPSIVICVLLEPLIAQVPELHREFQMRDLKGNSLTDDLQIHLLQLTYLQVTRENLATATPIERWAFFLLNAEQLSEAELRDLFPEPEFDEAARMEFALEKGLQKGREEGEKKGRQEGELIGQIMILQELLSVTEPTRDELTRFEMSRLTELAEQLRLQLRTRGD
jgi:predicted transposase/invertase (TIGR01784 family)